MRSLGFYLDCFNLCIVQGFCYCPALYEIMSWVYRLHTWVFACASLLSGNGKRLSASKWKHFIKEEQQISGYILTIVVLQPPEAAQQKLACHHLQVGTCPVLSEWNVALRLTLHKLWLTLTLMDRPSRGLLRSQQDTARLGSASGLLRTASSGLLLPSFSRQWRSRSFRPSSFP